MIKKADIILLILIVAVGLSVSWLSIAGSTEGDKVKVTVGGELYGVYSLAEDQEITVAADGHTNIIVIESGTVRMASSDCRNQVCVDTGTISETSDSIVCLPNKVVVEIINDEGGDADVISG